jgi:uncharacterized membrane protein YccC
VLPAKDSVLLQLPDGTTAGLAGHRVVGRQAAIVFGVVVVCLVAVLSEPARQRSPRPLDALAGLLLAMAVAALVFRRRFPATVPRPSAPSTSP